MIELADKPCIEGTANTPPVRGEQAAKLLKELGGGWKIGDTGHLEKTFVFKNFVEAISFANQVGDIAEEQRHHPDLHIGWGRCGVEIWTHTIGGLSESDFYLAAKVNRAHNQIVEASESNQGE
jgi:4a-hydroxytetrahydrobiopterin dehydratase